MRTYTIQQLQHLRDVRLKGFVQNEMCDDHYTNEYYEFMHNTDKFLHWLTKMEQENKIDHLLMQGDSTNSELKGVTL